MAAKPPEDLRLRRKITKASTRISRMKRIFPIRYSIGASPVELKVKKQDR